MCINTIIWDLDGTLLDTLEDLAQSVNWALMQNGLPTCTNEQVRSFVGNGIRNLIARATPEGEENPKFDQIFSEFKVHYAQNCENNTRPYLGVPELLETLKARGYRMAIVSNKADFAVKKLAATHFPDIDVAIGEREGIHRKPAPDSVFRALEALGANAQDALYVGDSEVDVQTAKNAGLACICVSWGFRDSSALERAGAERIVGNTKELLDAIQKSSGGKNRLTRGTTETYLK